MALACGDAEPEVGVEPTTFRLRGKRRAPGWTDRHRDCLVALSAGSGWTDPDGGNLIVGMIKEMIIELSILG
jgi:hypothetical protein